MSLPDLSLNNILAIDYGRRRVGLAICNAGTSIAFGLTTLFISGFKDLLSQLRPILEERKIQQVLIGLPLTLGNKPGALWTEVLNLRRYLQSEKISVVFVDEALSSRQAAGLLNQRSQRHRREDLDRTAAAWVLQEYLNGNLPPLSAEEIQRFQDEFDHQK